MRAEYIINAINTLLECEKLLIDFNATAEQRGGASARAWLAANQLRVYSGINDVEVEIETAPSHVMTPKQWLDSIPTVQEQAE